MFDYILLSHLHKCTVTNSNNAVQTVQYESAMLAVVGTCRKSETQKYGHLHTGSMVFEVVEVCSI